MEKIGIGVIGLNFGRHMVENEILKGPGAPFLKLEAVCDADIEKARRLAAPWGVKAYASVEELLEDKAIEAVGLFTGPNGRSQLLKRIASAGRHIMTTKPFELDPNAAIDVLEDAERLGITLHLNSPSPKPSPDLELFAKWSHEFDLGRPVLARWDTYASYDEKADGSWYDDPARCPVAPIFRLGIYGINDLLRLCGSPASVQVAHSRIATGRPTPDNASLSISFKGGALGQVSASLCSDDGRIYSNALEVRYERGSITRECEYPSRAARLSLRLKGSEGKIERTETVPSELRSGAYDWKTFSESVRSASPTPSDKKLISDSIKLINAMARSERSASTESIA